MLTTGVAIAFTGTIGLVGLVAHQRACGLVGVVQRALIPRTGLASAILLAAAFVASEIIAYKKQFLLGIVIAFVDVSFSAGLILAQRRSYR